MTDKQPRDTYYNANTSEGRELITAGLRVIDLFADHTIQNADGRLLTNPDNPVTVDIAKRIAPSLSLAEKHRLLDIPGVDRTECARFASLVIELASTETTI